MATKIMALFISSLITSGIVITSGINPKEFNKEKLLIVITSIIYISLKSS
jgi:hypothetical protein